MIGAADLNAAVDDISRDIDELLRAGWFGVIVLTLIFGLPATSLVAVLVRRWLALVPLVLSLGLGFVWGAYYATDWIGPQSGPGMLWLFVLITLIGWFALVLAVTHPGRAEQTRLQRTQPQ